MKWIFSPQAAGQFEKLGGSSKALRKAVANVIEGYRILGAFLRDEYRPHVSKGNPKTLHPTPYTLHPSPSSP